ncbi:hypothetical protein AAH979_20775 [Plantactinospora sp. ZYX-F-223]|uniref:hypothetical protein n=1 Tax=Plantactinospora sp. ZYX-F-223 TaxID=3144103 RepID=UPI0031FC3680
MKMDELAARFNLKLRSSYDPTLKFEHRAGYDYISCDIRTYDDGERFRTPLKEFDPGGTVTLRRYPNHDDAKGDHDAAMSSLRALEQSRTELSTKAVNGGWWDEGMYVQRIDPIDPKQYPRVENLDAAEVGVGYELRHGNLLIRTHLDTQAPTPQIEQVLAFLRDFADAFTKDAVTHLARTSPD